MTYLGILVSDRMLFATDSMGVGVKVEKKITFMAGAPIVLGWWESILIEGSLSSLPNYIMGIYLLPGPVHQKMDSAKATFYWDARVKRMYHITTGNTCTFVGYNR
jgi:hypothetical protein